MRPPTEVRDGLMAAWLAETLGGCGFQSGEFGYGAAAILCSSDMASCNIVSDTTDARSEVQR